jgi:hypothetical protein
VEQIKIDAVRAEPFQLLGEQALEVGLLLEEPSGALGGQVQLVPHPVALDRLAREDLALAAVVTVGRIHVVDALIQAGQQGLLGLLLVDTRRVAVERRRASAEAERGNCFSGISEIVCTA